ncbi:unnamed protein product, partial [Larinioides sclopetarius]
GLELAEVRFAFPLIRCHSLTTKPFSMATSPDNSLITILTSPLDKIYLTDQAYIDIEEDFSLQDKFNCLVRESIIYFLKLQDDKIVYYKIEDVFHAEECGRYKEHLRHHLRKQIFGSPEKINERSFADIINHFSVNQPKMKLFCRYGYYYLVKKYFTEGVQYVRPGEMHTYKAIGKPLYIYQANCQLDLKSFKTNYETLARQEKILPGVTKNIPSNTYYFVLARCHTIFKKVSKHTRS